MDVMFIRRLFVSAIAEDIAAGVAEHTAVSPNACRLQWRHSLPRFARARLLVPDGDEPDGLHIVPLL